MLGLKYLHMSFSRVWSSKIKAKSTSDTLKGMQLFFHSCLLFHPYKNNNNSVEIFLKQRKSLNCDSGHVLERLSY